MRMLGGFGIERCQHGGERVGASCDRQPRQPDAMNFGSLCRWSRNPLAVRRAEIDHQPGDRDRLVGEASHADAAHLDQPGQRRRRSNQQPPVARGQLDAVIGDQTGKADEAGGGR